MISEGWKGKKKNEMWIYKKMRGESIIKIKGEKKKRRMKSECI